MAASGSTRFDWLFFVQWALVTTLGWIVGWTFIGEIGIGLSVGAFQWLALRGRMRDSLFWIVASALGWILGRGVALYFFGPEIGVLAGLLVGTFLGLAQWIVLRWESRLAHWWVPVSAVSWFLGLSGYFGAWMVGAVAGLVSGLAIAILFRREQTVQE